MSQAPKKYLFSMKSLMVMGLLIALFGALNTIEHSGGEEVSRRGIPLTFSETVPAGRIDKLSDDRESRTFYMRETMTDSSKSWRSQFKTGATARLNLDDPDGLIFGLSDGTLAVLTWVPANTFNTLNLILNMIMGSGLSALLAFACERLVFRRFRADHSVGWRPTGPR